MGVVEDRVGTKRELPIRQGLVGGPRPQETAAVTAQKTEMTLPADTVKGDRGIVVANCDRGTAAMRKTAMRIAVTQKEEP